MHCVTLSALRFHAGMTNPTACMPRSRPAIEARLERCAKCRPYAGPRVEMGGGLSRPGPAIRWRVISNRCATCAVNAESPCRSAGWARACAGGRSLWPERLDNGYNLPRNRTCACERRREGCADWPSCAPRARDTQLALAAEGAMLINAAEHPAASPWMPTGNGRVRVPRPIYEESSASEAGCTGSG